ncbi:MAG TPA: hypothetical protein DEA45_03555 [Acholeplasmataceae bacterium]|nr:hypothetical protein [Acholeplasmataceae bacterium]
MKKTIQVLTIFLLLSLMVGCQTEKKTFEKNGVSITLTDRFIEKEVVQVGFYLESNDHIFMSNRESKESLSYIGVSSLSQYTTQVLASAGKTAEVHTSEDGYRYAYYESVVNDQSFGYMLLTFEGEDHFYTMNFGCLSKNLEKNKSLYFQWAKTIVIE